MPTANLDHLPAISSLLDVVCRMTGMGLAMVTRMHGEHWVACAVRDEIGAGIVPGHVLPIELTPCYEVKERERLLVINDLTRDPAHSCNPVLVGGRFRSYIAAPIKLADDSFFGTLCALSHQPSSLDASEVEGTFRLFAGLVADQLNSADRTAASAADLRTASSRLDISETGRQHAEAQLVASAASLQAVESQLAVSDAALLDAHATALLREQFVAVLGHDLRNPLSAILSGTTLLQRQPLDERGRRVLGLMEQSAGRMIELVRNMLDFALTQLGGGIPVGRQTTMDLGATLRHVVKELEARHPGRVVTAHLDLDVPVSCDPDRIGQLLSNLLANALTHGAAEQPVRVSAEVRDGVFELAVANCGKVIPPEAMGSLFKPFVRGNKQSREGLGLGLHIAAAIAHAHGGALTATSTSAETRFVLRMPSASPTE